MDSILLLWRDVNLNDWRIIKGTNILIQQMTQSSLKRICLIKIGILFKIVRKVKVAITIVIVTGNSKDYIFFRAVTLTVFRYNAHFHGQSNGNTKSGTIFFIIGFHDNVKVTPSS